MRYANNSNYKNDTIIKKECFVTEAVLQELRRIIEDSEVRFEVGLQRHHHTGVAQILKEDDSNWPEPDRVGRQELEIILGDEHISFATTKLGSLLQVQQSNDPDGLRVFYYLVQVWMLLIGGHLLLWECAPRFSIVSCMVSVVVIVVCCYVHHWASCLA